MCADYNPSTKPDRKECVFVSDKVPYVRSAIFPWGRKAQKYQGHTVVSERAIKHLNELIELKANWRYWKTASSLFSQSGDGGRCVDSSSSW